MQAAVARFKPADMAVDPDLLTAAELSRRDQLQRATDRTAYAAAHVLVRICVAELTGASLESVRIVQQCPQCSRPGHGAPSVIGHPRIGISLSHSSRHVAAIAAWGPAGVDVETLDDDRVLESVMSPRERAWVAAQPEPARAFRRLWVRKEALIKSGGAALDDVASLDVLVETDAGELHPDSSTYTEWSTTDAVGAWTVQLPPERSRSCPPGRQHTGLRHR